MKVPRYLSAVAMLAAAYWAAAVLGLQWAAVDGAGSPVWPAAGIALAGLLLGGARLWPAIVLGRLAAGFTVTSAHPLWIELCIAGGNAGAAVAAVLLLQHFRIDLRLIAMRDMLWLALGSALSALIAAIVGASVLGFSVDLGEQRTLFVAFSWAIGNFVGMLTVTPLILVWSRREAWEMPLSQWMHLAGVLSATIVVSLIVFFVEMTPAYVRTWWVFPILIWAALAFQVKGAAVALVIVSGLSIWGVTSDAAFPGFPGGTDERVFLAQQFAVVICLTMLILAAVADERRGKEALKESEQRLAYALEATTEGIWDWNIKTGEAKFSRRWIETLGYRAEEVPPRIEFWKSLVHPEDKRRVMEVLQDHFEGRTPYFGVENRLRQKDGQYRWNLARGKVVEWDTDGSPLRIVGSDADISDRKQAEEAVRESEHRFELALRAGRMGAWEWNVDTGEVISSPGLEEIHGLQPGSFGHTIADFKKHISPDDVEEVTAKLQHAVETDEDYHVLYRTPRRYGRMRWLEAFGMVLLNGPGKPKRMVGVSADVTERKEAEAQRDLLLAELSHRVKNTLSTVIAIARQSFRRGNEEKERVAFEARLRALALTHARLAEASWTGVSLETIILDEVAPYRQADGSNLKISGPTLTLSPKAAVSIGLAVHELATNAAKYGALSSEKGKVEVRWEVTSPTREVRIVWTEFGGPPVQPSGQSGFGRLMLERVLASDLGGEVALEFAREGVRCVIVFSADKHVAA